MKNTPSCVLTFKKHDIDKIEYIKNKKFNKEGFKDLDISIGTNIIYPKNIDDRSFLVKLKVEIGKNAEINNYPFYLLTEITGYFELDKSEINNIEYFAKVNATSILFPYVRALITTITANANIPPVVLPPMNIAAMMENNNNNNNKNIRE